MIYKLLTKLEAIKESTEKPTADIIFVHNNRCYRRGEPDIVAECIQDARYDDIINAEDFKIAFFVRRNEGGDNDNEQ